MNCARHPDTETSLSCGRCNTPVCVRCMVHTDVGIRCRTCAPVRRGIPGLGSNRFRNAAIVVGVVFVAVLLIGGGSQLGGSSGPDPNDYRPFIEEQLEQYRPEVTASRLIDPWKPTSSPASPRPGRRLVALEVTVEYPRGRQETHYVSSAHFKLVDGDDFAHGAVTSLADPPLSEGLELAPGQKTRGWVMFELDDGAEIKAVAYGNAELDLPEAETALAPG
jgi:Domain of unknown function (DUF4352)